MTTIGERLAVGFGVVLLLVFGLVAADYLGEQRQSGLEFRLTGLIMPRADAANDVEIAYLQEAAAVRGYVYSGDEQYLAQYRKSADALGSAIVRLRGLPSTGDGDGLVGEIQPLASQYSSTAEQAIVLRQQGQVAEAERVVERDMAPVGVQLTEKTEALVALQFSLRDAAVAELRGVRAETVTETVALALLMLLVGVVVAWYTIRSVRNPTHQLLMATETLGKGDYDSALGLAARLVGRGEGARDEVRRLAGAFAIMVGRLRQRERRLEVRAKLSSVLASTLDLETLASEGLREIVEYAGFELGLVFAHDEEAGLLRKVAAFALGETPETIRLGDGIVGEAAASRRSVVVGEIPEDSPFHIRLGFDQLPPRTVVAIPMMCEEHLVGVVLVGSLRDLTKDTLDFLEVSAQQLAVSLQNAIAHDRIEAMAGELREKNELLVLQNEELQAQNEEIQAQSEELQTQSESLAEQNVQLAIRADRIAKLQDLAAHLSRHLAPEEVLPRVVDAAADLLDSSLAAVLLLDPDGGCLTVGAALGLDEKEQSSPRMIVADSLAGRAIAEGRTLFIGDFSRDQVGQLPALADGARVGAMIVAPMVVAGETLGVIEVYAPTPRDFLPEDVDLLSALAATAAVAIHNARLFSDVSRQRQLLESVVASIPEAVHVIDGGGRLVTANDAARRLYDLEECPKLQEWLEGNGAAQDPAELGLWSATARALRGSTVLGEEVAYSSASTGRSGFVQVSAAPVFVPGESRTAAVVTVAADVSRLKELDQLKDEFISEASHELKTPLTAVKGFTQLLQRRMSAVPDGEGYRKMLSTIDGQVDRLVRLVDRLLDVSRAQAGRLQLRIEPVDLAALVRQQVQLAQVKTDRHRLVVELGEGITGLWDRGYLEQVVGNLLENAIQYSPKGGQIRIALQKEVGVARLVVADSGIGMSPATLEKLFQRHYRAAEAREVRVDGMGLGLYLCREIVTAHGGRIWAESEQGKGSIFTVELPLSSR